MRFKIFKISILFWTAFIGLGAFLGGICMLIKPDGSILHMQDMLPYFSVLPFSDILFQDYIFSGISLIIVNGLTNTLAFILIILNKRIGYVLGTIFGFTLMLWIIIQFVIFPPNLLDALYFTFGVLQLICGYNALVSYNQKYFIFNEEDYKINKESNILVVYFSRLKYTKRIAYIKANNLNADIYEIKTKERTENTLGFWWCGRFGMHKWPMEILPIDNDLNKYEKIVIVTPIWVFRMCGPIRDFIIKYKDLLNNKNVDIVFNHFNPWLPKGAVNEIKKHININNIESKTTMLGHTFKLEKINN